MASDYIKYYGGKMEDFIKNETPMVTDEDVLREEYKFIRTAEDDKDETVC